MPFLASSPVLNGKKQLPSVKKPKVFCLPAGLSGCAYWRYRLPFGKLKKLGSELDITVADNPDKKIRMSDIQEHLQASDVISLQSPAAQDSVTLMKLYKSEGKKVVVDYDDYSFDLSPGNPRYNMLGIEEKEVVGADGKPVFKWRDQENGFDVKENRAKFEGFKRCVEMADMVTTTTDYLASKFRAYNRNVQVCPNSVDFERWKPLPRPKSLDGQVRIGWFGGDSHYVDLKLFKGLIPRVLAKFPQVKFVFQGPMVPEWGEFFKDVDPKRIEWYQWTDLRYYTFFLGAKFWDIGLCPLEDNDFNRCKSNIKALEFQALGAAVVAQNIPPYAPEITHGKTGFLASTEDDWFECISRLVGDDVLRNRIAFDGYQDAKDRFDLDKNCRIWERKYLDLLGR